jgi:hypothetical protein
MNAPRYWELLDDACSVVETSLNAPRFSHPYGAMNFHFRFGNWDPTGCTAVLGGGESLGGSHRTGGIF